MSRKPASIRQLWGIAKSPELRMERDDLYALVYRETGKEHLTELTQGELDRVARVLQNLKDGVQRDTTRKRTDIGGQKSTEPLRRKIYALTEELGWNDDNRRINGFVKRMCGVERIEWLSKSQCVMVVEALKQMTARMKGTGQ